MSEPSPANGIIQLPSRHTVAETLDRLEGLLREHDVKVFARIDQRQEPVAVGLTLRKTELLIFGNPKAGTPIIEAFPSVTVELPLKVAAWQKEDGSAVIAYNSAEYPRLK